MKRSAVLIRKILICTEAEIPLDSEDQRLLNYHYQLLIEANLLNAIRVAENQWDIDGLTWDGHELLALIQNEDRWAAIMRVIDDLDCYSFEIIKQVAIQQMKI